MNVIQLSGPPPVVTSSSSSSVPASTTSSRPSVTTSAAPVFASAVQTGVANPPSASGTKWVWAHHMVGNVRPQYPVHAGGPNRDCQTDDYRHTLTPQKNGRMICGLPVRMESTVSHSTWDVMFGSLRGWRMRMPLQKLMGISSSSCECISGIWHLASRNLPSEPGLYNLMGCADPSVAHSTFPRWAAVPRATPPISPTLS